MILFYGILVILIAHYIADFIFQPHEMAQKKANSVLVLSLHAVIYSMIFFLMFAVGGMILDTFIASIDFHKWMLIGIGITTVNGILHYLIDFVTSKATKYFWQQKNMRNFFLVLGFDQLLHTGLLVYSYAEMLHNFTLV